MGVVALGITEEMNTLDVLACDVVCYKAAYLITNLLVYPLFQYLVLRPGLFHFFPNRVCLKIQDLGKLRGNKLLVLLAGNGQALPVLHSFCQSLGPFLIQLISPLLNHFRIQENRIRRGRNGQRLPVAVIDGPPGRGNSRALGLLAGGSPLHLLMAVDGQIIRLGKKGQERANAESHQQIHGSALNGQLCPTGCVRLSLGSVCHRFLLICTADTGTPAGIASMSKQGVRGPASYSPVYQ